MPQEAPTVLQHRSAPPTGAAQPHFPHPRVSGTGPGMPAVPPLPGRPDAAPGFLGRPAGRIVERADLDGPTLVTQSKGGFLAETSYRAEPARPFALLIAAGGVVTVLLIVAALAFWPGRTAVTNANGTATVSALPPPPPVPVNDTPQAPVKPKPVVKPVPKKVVPKKVVPPPVVEEPVKPVPEPAPKPEPAPEPDPEPVPDPPGNPAPPQAD